MGNVIDGYYKMGIVAKKHVPFLEYQSWASPYPGTSAKWVSGAKIISLDRFSQTMNLSAIRMYWTLSLESKQSICVHVDLGFLNI